MLQWNPIVSTYRNVLRESQFFFLSNLVLEIEGTVKGTTLVAFMLCL